MRLKRGLPPSSVLRPRWQWLVLRAAAPRGAELGRGEAVLAGGPAGLVARRFRDCVVVARRVGLEAGAGFLRLEVVHVVAVVEHDGALARYLGTTYRIAFGSHALPPGS